MAFQKMLFKQVNGGQPMTIWNFKSLSIEETTTLELLFSLEEIDSTLKELNRDKALSPDGFMVAFW